MIEYKGYTGVFEFDPSIDAFHGRVVGLRDVVTFEGRSVDELRREMEESIEDYLELCAEAGKDPERSYRGEFLVRTTPDVHRAVAAEAEASGMSLNAWVERAINTVVREHPASEGYRSEEAETSAERGTTKTQSDVVQVKNPRTGKYVKIDRAKGEIIAHKRSAGPYKGVPVATIRDDDTE